MLSTKLNEYYLRSVYLCFTMLVTAFSTFYMFINDDNMNAMGTQRGFLVSSISLLCWSICAFWLIKDVIIHPISTISNPYRHKTICWYNWFVIIVCVSILLTNEKEIKEMIADHVTYLLPGVGLWGAYGYSRHYGEQRYIYLLFGFILCCILFAYYIIYTAYNVIGERGHFGTAYYVLYILPIFLTNHKKWVRYLAIITSSIVIISSVKRGGLLALLLGIFVYLVVKRKAETHSNKNLLIILLSFIGIVLLFYLAIFYLGGDILERFFDSDDDTGSGRTLIWEGIITRLQNQNTINWCIGNGHLATMKGTIGERSGFSAHNDFLEILFDYGLFAIFSYIGFLFSWGRYTFKSIKQHSRYAAPLAMLLTMYVTLSMVSIIVLYYTSLLSMLTMGCLIGWNEFEKHKNHYENRNTNISSCA